MPTTPVTGHASDPAPATIPLLLIRGLHEQQGWVYTPHGADWVGIP